MKRERKYLGDLGNGEIELEECGKMVRKRENGMSVE